MSSHRVFMVAALAVAIALVELGVRAPDHGIAVAVATPSPLAGAVERLRAVPQQHIDDPAVAAVVAGVVFGRADDVAVDDQQAFLDAGLWHLLAASGQNIALVVAGCVLVARAAGAGRTTGSIVALVAIPAYVVVVGGGASIVRAGITGMLVIVAWLAGRIADPRQLMVSVAAVTCWVWPGAHRGLGMQLSYACVAALVTWAVPLTRAIASRGVPTWLAGAIATTGLCSLATAPILQLRTGSAPLVGIAANIVAVPLAGALLVVGLTTSLLVLSLGSLGHGLAGTILMQPAGVLGAALAQVARRAASLPGASSSSFAVNVGVPVACLVVAVLLPRLASPSIRRRAIVVIATTVGGWIAAGGIGMSGLPGAAMAAPRPGMLRIGVLDIGQGDATLLAIDGHALLVDTGPPGGRVVRRVRELGVDHVDAVVLTHDSLDHRGGYDDARTALDPEWIARPRHAPGPWRHVQETAPRLVDLCAGDSFRLGPVRVDVLHPRCDGRITPHTGDLHNDGAMVLLVTHGDVRVLLPADAEAPVLNELSLPLLDLLRVSHHGSADPELPELLAGTHPRAAAISAGEGNDYGHPRAQVLHDLTAAGVLTRRTDRDGTAVFESDGTTLSIVE